MSRVGLVTIAHGRHAHWRMQEKALRASARQADVRVVVAMDDAGLAGEAREFGALVVEFGRDPRGLPLARARNAGAAAAIRAGAGVLVFLDVDCLPSPDLLGAYADAAESQVTRECLLSGPVTYLDPPPAAGYDLSSLHAVDRPHPVRPAPRPGQVVVTDEHELFWSLSFAVSTGLWNRLGGFCERYAGYGAEDTDFAMSARIRGVRLAWVGSARAYHQHHPVSDPPVEHVDAIVRNAGIFHDRWGMWPMRGWLDEFERLGLIRRSRAGRFVTAG